MNCRIGTEWLNEALNDMLCGLKNSYIRRYNKANSITRLRVRYGLCVSGGHRGNDVLLMGIFAAAHNPSGFATLAMLHNVLLFFLFEK